MDNKLDEYESKFHELSSTLGDSEKRRLLRKLSKYKSDNSRDDKKQEIEDNYSKSKILATHAQNLYNSLNFFSKIIVFFVSLFTGRKATTIVVDWELNEVKNTLVGRYSKIVHTEEEKFTHVFISKFKPLYNNIQKIHPVFKALQENQTFYYEFLAYELEKSASDQLLEHLEETLPENLETKKDYMDKNNYFSERDKRLKKYFNKLDTMVFSNLNIQFQRFELFSKLVMFNYQEILRWFFISDFDIPIEATNYSKAKDLLPILEHFFRLISSIHFSYHDFYMIEDFVKFFSQFPITDEKDNSIIEVDGLESVVMEIFSNLEQLQKDIPFYQLFQYFLRDVQYKIRLLSINIEVQQIYRMFKRQVTENIWANYFYKLRKDYIVTLIDKLFINYDFCTLNYYNLQLKEKLERYSGLKLKDYYTLNILDEFLHEYFREKMEPFINIILIDGSFNKEITHSNVSASYYTLNAGITRLEAFDNGFSPGAEVEKKIALSVRKVTSDPNFKTPIINILTDINEESYKLKFELIESLQIITKFLKAIMDFENPQNAPLSNFNSLKSPGYPNAFIAVEQSISYLDIFLEIYTLIEESF